MPNSNPETYERSRDIQIAELFLKSYVAETLLFSQSLLEGLDRQLTLVSDNTIKLCIHYSSI